MGLWPRIDAQNHGCSDSAPRGARRLNRILHQKLVLGALVALVLYILVGVARVVSFNISLSGARFADFLRPSALLIILLWPLQAAQVLGLSGLSFR